MKLESENLLSALLKIVTNKIRDLFKVKLYAIRSETKKKRERIKSVCERERDSETLNI